MMLKLMLCALYAMALLPAASCLITPLSVNRHVPAAGHAASPSSSNVSRRGLGRALVSVPFIASLIPAVSFAAPPTQTQGSPVSGENQEKSLLSSFSYPEPEPFVLRSQQLKIGGKKPMKGAGELGGKGVKK